MSGQDARSAATKLDEKRPPCRCEPWAQRWRADHPEARIRGWLRPPTLDEVVDQMRVGFARLTRNQRRRYSRALAHYGHRRVLRAYYRRDT